MTGPATAASVSPALPGPDSLTGLAAFGKVAFAMLVILAVIFLCAWLLKRMGASRTFAGGHLRIVAGKSVGPREKVVIVEVDRTWLVLGVTSQNIRKLHDMPAKDSAVPSSVAPREGDSFGKRFAAALKHNLGGKS